MAIDTDGIFDFEKDELTPEHFAGLVGAILDTYKDGITTRVDAATVLLKLCRKLNDQIMAETISELRAEILNDNSAGFGLNQKK